MESRVDRCSCPAECLEESDCLQAALEGEGEIDCAVAEGLLNDKTAFLDISFRESQCHRL